MGRIIVPVSAIPVGTSKKWYTIGRTPASPTAAGRIEISITLKTLDDATVLFLLFFVCIYNVLKNVNILKL